MRKILRKLKFYSGYLVSLPLAFCCIVLFPFYKIKFVKLFSDRIGHYAENTELMLCTLDVKKKELKKNKYLFYTCDSSVPICNDQLHLMWHRVIPIMSFPQIAHQADKILSFVLGERYKNDVIKLTFEPTSGVIDVNGLLSRIPTAHLKFNAQEEEWGQQQLAALGIPMEAKIVCLMVRDNGYLKQHIRGIDWSYHNFRNADISHYQRAAEYLAERGYYVVRMGKHVEKKFAVDHPHVIDYANHPLRSDFLDIYLCAHCHFFISTCTGIDGVARIFRRPGVFTNIVLPGELPTWYPSQLFIPKKVKNRETHTLLTFKEIYSIFVANKQMKTMEILKAYNLEVIENNSEELLEVITEMESRMTGSWQDQNSAIILQQKFWNDFPCNQKNSNGAPMFAKNIKVKIGRFFLEQNSALLN